MAGRLADWGGHQPAYAVTVLAAGISTLAALAVLLTGARRSTTPGPSTSRQPQHQD